MKSLRELRSELTGIRLGAVDTSIWSIGAQLELRANLAVNEGIRSFDFAIQEVYNSLPVGVRTVAVPRDVARIIGINAIREDVFRVTPVKNFLLTPTGTTNILKINDYTIPSNYRLELTYTRKIGELPDDLTIVSVNNSLIGANIIYPNKWPEGGCIELTDNSLTKREVIRYNSVTSSVFVIGTRAIEGYSATWQSGDRISAAVPLEGDDLSVIMLQAEASMYQYWLGHRAQYDQYTAVAGLQALDVETITGMVVNLEARAERRYKHTRKAPAPTNVRRL